MTSDPRSTQRERVTREQWRNSLLVGVIVVSIVMTFELLGLEQIPGRVQTSRPRHLCSRVSRTARH